MAYLQFPIYKIEFFSSPMPPQRNSRWSFSIQLATFTGIVKRVIKFSLSLSLSLSLSKNNNFSISFTLLLFPNNLLFMFQTKNVLTVFQNIYSNTNALRYPYHIVY